MSQEKIHQIIGTAQSQTTTKQTTFFYEAKDKGPYVVYMDSSQKTDNAIGKMSSLKIAREIFQLNLKNVNKINNKGSNRISIEFSNFQSANDLINNENLKNKGYNIFIPGNYITCKGIVRHIDVDENIEDFDNICQSSVPILNAKRLNRKVIKEGKIEYVPTGTILFTFKGTYLPKIVYFYNLPYPVNIYVSPVTQCYSCLLYGHTKKNCKGKAKCFNCAENVHLENETETFPCKTKCHFCREEHKTTNKSCQEHKRQQEIKKLMAYENITFFDADKMCPKNYIPNREYVLDPRKFPSTLNKTYNANIDQVITPSQRRTADFNANKSKRTYQQALSNGEKRRLIQVNHNKESHNEQLYCPNSRPENYKFTAYLQDYDQTTNMPNSAFNPFNSSTQPSSSKDESDYIKNMTENFINISKERQIEFKNFIIRYLENQSYNDRDKPKRN